MTLMHKGQISLEFLIVLFVMIAILLIFMPVFSKLQGSLLLALDVYNASKSLQEFQTNVSMLNTLENGSSFTFEQNYIFDANFNCDNNVLTIGLANNYQSKSLSKELALNCNFLTIIDKKVVLLITKQSQYDLNISLLSN